MQNLNTKSVEFWLAIAKLMKAPRMSPAKLARLKKKNRAR